MALLEARALRREFGGLTAVDDVSFDVAAESITALIGPNGAGKTTIFNLVTGFVSPTAGTVRFDGADITGLPSHLLARRGLTRTFQNVELFGSMTVLENVMVGMHCRTKAGFLRSLLRVPSIGNEERKTRREALELLRFVGLAGQDGLPAGSLAFGQQRLLEIARALAAAPRLLILDEPAAGLNNHESEALGQLIRRIQATGVTVLLVEHDMDLVMSISERVIVLAEGRTIAEGTPAQVQADARVIAAYLGEEAC